MRDSSPPGCQVLRDPADTQANELVSSVLHETLGALRAAGNPGASYEAVGQRCGVPKQHVNEWCSPGYERSPKLAKIARMGPTVGPAVLRSLAARLEARAGHRDIPDAALGLLESSGVVARCVREALTDGEISDAEERALEASLLGVEAEIAATRAAIARKRMGQGR